METGIVLDTKNILNCDINYDLIEKDFMFVKFGTVKQDGTITVLGASDVVFKNSPIPCGAYVDFHCNKTEVVENSAKVLAQQLKKYNLQYPVVIDLGDRDSEKYFVGLTKDEITEIVKKFLDSLKSYGYYGIVRTDTIFYKNSINMSKIPYDLMLKDYRHKNPSHFCSIHEHTVLGNKNNGGVENITWFTKGQQAGVAGDVIQLKCFKDYKKIIKDGDWNMYKEPNTIIENPKDKLEPSNPIKDKPVITNPTEISTLIDNIVLESNNLKSDIDNIVKNSLDKTLNKIKEMRSDLK